MAYASRAGRARVSAKNPLAQAVCMRCGIWYNRVNLTFQFEWTGAQLQNRYILVCNRCLDIPQEQLRAITLPADPVPIFYPSIENFEAAEANYRTLSRPTIFDPVTGIPIPDTTLRVTEDCQDRTVNPYGIPSGLIQNAVMPYNGGVQRAFGVPLSLLSVTSNGTATVQVTCSAPHNLHTDDQVSIEGLAYGAANGFYSVSVLGATTLTYMTYGAIPAQALLTPTTRIITCLVGLPRGYKRIPKLYGPSLITGLPTQVCFLVQQDGSGLFLLEDGSGSILLEQCMQPPTATFYFDLEDSLGEILLEDGTDFLEQEVGP